MRRGASRRSKSPPPKRKGGKSPPRFSPQDIRRRLAAQRQQAREASLIRNLKKLAQGAKDKFRPKKSERGRLVLVTTTGKRASVKGRKGYLVYVTKTGKKQLIRESGKHGQATQLRPRKLTDIEVPIRRNLRKAAQGFIKARKKTIAHRVLGAKRLNERKTRIPKNTGGHDFSEKTIRKIARDIKRALESTVSHRSYIISVIALVKLPGGITDTIEFLVPIARQDHQAIQLGGIENFVRFKFYAFLAKALQFKGYITTGSANHIRSQMDLQSIREVSQSDWETYHSQSGHTVNSWDAPRFQICRLETIEYKIERIQT